MNIFVANIDQSVDSEKLKALFGLYGKVTSVTITVERTAGNRVGFGCVDMPDAVEAAKAISALNNTVVSKKNIRVYKGR